MNVAAQMRQRKLPFDVIYYDAFDQQAVSKPFVDELWNRYRARLTVGFGMPMFGTWRGNDDSTLLNDLAARGFLMVDRNNRPAIGRDTNVEDEEDKSSVAYLDYFSPRAVDHVFTVKWNDALTNGAILGMVDFGEMDHVRNADQKFWPSNGMSVAQTRNLFGLGWSRASSTASVGAAPEWCGLALREANGWAGPRPEIRFRPMPISARIPAPC